MLIEDAVVAVVVAVAVVAAVVVVTVTAVRKSLGLAVAAVDSMESEAVASLALVVGKMAFEEAFDN